MSQYHHQFSAIAQPIISQERHEIYAMEILSRSAQVLDIESFFKTMSPHESMLFTCSQLELIDKIPDGVKININAVNESVLDIYFLNELEKVNAKRVAIEIDYFNPNINNIDQLIVIVNHMKCLGCEVWLDDYRADDNSNILFSIPWTGVKIDKELVWRMMEHSNTLEDVILNCKRNGFLVTLEGVENRYIYDLAKNTSADFLQGYYWQAEKL